MNADQAIQSVENYIFKTANTFAYRFGSRIAKEDLIQEGKIGAFIAWQKYNPNKGVKFFTHAHPWILLRIRRFCQEHGRTINVPVWILDKHLYVDKDAMLYDGWGTQHALPLSEDFTISSDNCILVDKLCGCLNQTEKDILHMYYFEGKDFRSIGTAINKSKSGASFIHQVALEKIRKSKVFREAA